MAVRRETIDIPFEAPTPFLIGNNFSMFAYSRAEDTSLTKMYDVQLLVLVMNR